jgi:hypothetical protein
VKKRILFAVLLIFLLSGCQKEASIKIKDPESYQLLLVEKTKNNRSVAGDSIVIKDSERIRKILKEVSGLKGKPLPAKALIRRMKSQAPIILSFSKKNSLHDSLHPDYVLEVLEDGRVIFPDTSQKPIKMAFITKKGWPDVVKNIQKLIGEKFK